MKTFYLKILHAGMSYSYAEVRADYFQMTEGAYVFYNQNTDVRRDEDVLICAYPISLTIIESIEEENANVSI